MSSKPMSERETRIHILEHARVSGYEAPVREIFRKVDEAMKNAKSQDEKNMIALQGLSEIDAYFKGGSSNLDNVTLTGFDQSILDKFNKR